MMNEKNGNTFLGLVILVIILAVLYFTLRWILELLSILKTYNAIIVVAIITGFVTIGTTTFKAIWDIKQTRLHYLTQKREAAYYHFVEIIYKINQSSKENSSYSSEEQIADLIKFSKEITLWGVLRRLLRNGWNLGKLQQLILMANSYSKYQNN